MDPDDVEKPTLANVLRTFTAADVIRLVGVAAILGGAWWQLQEMKARVEAIGATAIRSEMELIRLNTMLDQKAQEADRLHMRIDSGLTDHEHRLRSLEGRRR